MLKTRNRNKSYIRGEKNPLYKGNKKLVTKIREIPEYLSWRNEVFKRDNYTCQDCDKRGVKIEAHHKKEFSKILKENNIKNIEEALSCGELWDISNGKTLCKKCHNKIRKKK